MKAIEYLNRLQQVILETDFRLRYNQFHLPDAIMWMTPFIKNSLVRYGDILCLDAKKRQYSRLWWPYIVSCVNNGDKKVIVATK